MTLTDLRRGRFRKLAITDIRCTRGRAATAHSHAVVHTRSSVAIGLCGHPCGRAVLRSGFGDTGYMVTAYPLTASAPITCVLPYPLLCGFNVSIKMLTLVT